MTRKILAALIGVVLFGIALTSCQTTVETIVNETEYGTIPEDNDNYWDDDDNDSESDDPDNNGDDDSADNTDGAGGGTNLALPFAHDEHWILTRAYNTESHIDYGYDWYDDRYAVDFALPGCGSWRKPITPIRAGVVEQVAFDSDGYGNYVLVDHPEGNKSRYAHFDEVMVEENDAVTTATVIGLAGNTGAVFGTACPDHPGLHVHVAYYVDGSGVLPEPLSGHTDLGDKVGCAFGRDNWLDCDLDGVEDEPVVGDDDDVDDDDAADDDAVEPDDDDDVADDDDLTPTDDDDAMPSDDDDAVDDDDATDDDDAIPEPDPCTFVVPSDASTIQDGIDLTNPNDTVCVEAGDYMGPITFPTHDIELISIDGAELTHLYSSGAVGENVVTFDGTNTNATLFQGFTVHGEIDTNTLVWAWGGSPTLANLDILCLLDGQSNFSGIGLGVYQSSGTVIVRNTHIGDCQFGMTVFGSSTVEGENLIVEGNTGYEPFYGTEYGAGVRAGNSSNLMFTNSVFDGNGNDGLLMLNANLTLINSIVTNHTRFGVSMEQNGTVFVSDFNAYYGNATDFGFYAAYGPSDSTQGPEYADPEMNDYTLQTSSPAIDSGNPASIYDDPDGTRNDKGAYGGPLGWSW